MPQLDQTYWENRYNKSETGWDVGGVSAPLKTYFNQLTDKAARILIPGAGNGHEVAYLFEQGFTNVFMLDISRLPIEKFALRWLGFPKDHLIRDDFFNHYATYDLIIEQTFFCALDPDLRPAYAKKMNALLAQNGTLAGLLFDDPKMQGGPPFGGSLQEYLTYFKPYFEIRTFERATNSIAPRAGRELFMILKKKNGTV